MNTRALALETRIQERAAQINTKNSRLSEETYQSSIFISIRRLKYREKTLQIEPPKLIQQIWKSEIEKK